MSIYFLVFALSCFFIYLSEKNKKNKGIRFICALIGILIPSILAGLRAETIGTDVMVYLKKIFLCAESTNDFKYYLTIPISSSRRVHNYGYIFIGGVYFVQKIFGNIHIAMFLIELAIITPIYLGLKRISEKENTKIWIGMLIFYLLYFNTSLNLMRQFISIAFIFYGISILLTEEKDTKYIFCLINICIAALFHKSALIGLIIVIYYFILNKNYKKIIKITGNFKIKFNKVFLFMFIFVGTWIITNTQLIANFLELNEMGRYANYINGEVSFVESSIIKVIPIIMLYVLQRKKFNDKFNNSNFYMGVFIYSILFQQLSSITKYGNRIALYFSIFNIVLYMNLCLSNKTKSRQILNIVYIVIYLGILWRYNFVLKGASETVPYLFYWK